MAMNFGIGNLIGKDATLRRKMWREAATHYGTPGCKYYEFQEGGRQFTIHGEIHGVYKDPIDLPIILLSQPEQETALRMGWITETEGNSVAQRAQLPYDTPGLCPGCKLAIPYLGREGCQTPQGGTEYNMFKITAIHSIARYPESWVVDLAVDVTDDAKLDIRKQLKPKSNYKYLKVDENS